MFDSILGNTLTLQSFLICIIFALVLGCILAILHMKTTKEYNANFVTTLFILPTLVSVVILLVNGNLGTGVAVAGAFSLIRFRSVPGNSREILNVFFAMAIGLAVGTGYVGFATLFTLITALISYILYKLKFGESSKLIKKLKIVIPEDLDYTDAFDKVFDKYLVNYNLDSAKTTNLGSMFELTYNVELKSDINEKKFIDELRVINGNLKIVLTHPLVVDEL